MEFPVGALYKVKLLQHRSCMVDNFIATGNTTTHVNNLLHKKAQNFSPCTEPNSSYCGNFMNVS